MAQGARTGRLARDVDGGVQSIESAANQSRESSVRQNSFAEAGRVSSTFGYRLDERMQAYSGLLNEFGCPGNTVDHWRVQFVSPEVSSRAANSDG